MLRERAQEPVRAIIEEEPREGLEPAPHPEGRRLLQELHGRGEDRVARHHAVEERAGRDRGDRRQKGSAESVREGVEARRSAALLGERRRRISATRNNTPCRSRSRDSACPTATTTCATTRSLRRPARRIRPTSRDSSPSATSPILRAPRRASSRSRRPSRSCNGIARAIAIATRPTTRWAWHAAGVDADFDWQAFLAADAGDAKDKVNEVIVRQPDYMKSIDAVIADVPLATWKEYLTFGLISAYADGLSAPFVDSRFEFTARSWRASRAQPRWKRGVDGVEQTLGEPVGSCTSSGISSPKRRRAWTRWSEPARGVQGGHRRARVDVAGDKASGASEAREVPREDRLSRSVARLLGARDEAGRSRRQPACAAASSRTTSRGRASASRSSAGAGA